MIIFDKNYIITEEVEKLRQILFANYKYRPITKISINRMKKEVVKYLRHLEETGRIDNAKAIINELSIKTDENNPHNVIISRITSE